MKIALCISGLMRTYSQTASSVLKHICNKYDTDIFVSTWNIVGHSVAKYSRTETDEDVDESDVRTKYNNQVKGLRVHNYENFKKRNEVKWKKEKYEWTKANNREGVCRVEHMCAMCYKIKSCNDLKNEYAIAHQINYDAVIRCRADMFFSRQVEIKEIKPMTVYTPSLYTWGLVNDQFAYGDTNSMNVYSSWYDYIEEYDKLDFMNITAPEMVLQHHLKTTGITQIEDDIGYALSSLVPRENLEKQRRTTMNKKRPR